MNKTKEIIKKCGGAMAISENLGITLNAVYKWRDRNNIPKPHKYWNALKAMAKERGVELTNEDFL